MFRLSHQCPLVSSSDWSCPAVGGRRLDSDVEEDAPNSPDVIQASGSGYGVTIIMTIIRSQVFCRKSSRFFINCNVRHITIR
jgi:hypothetical protein